MHLRFPSKTFISSSEVKNVYFMSYNFFHFTSMSYHDIRSGSLITCYKCIEIIKSIVNSVFVHLKERYRPLRNSVLDSGMSTKKAEIIQRKLTTVGI